MKKALWTATLLVVTLLPRGWAQPVDLLDPAGVAEAAKKKPRKPRKPPGFPIQPGIYRLHGIDPELPQNDLEPLRLILGEATIVSLGESFHTSGGYYEMKHRLFRFLVEKMGFRAFAFESPWEDADQVARYVATCAGSPEEALRGLFGVWESAETRDLVQWMCDWNRAHPEQKDKLVFFGFDVQQSDQDGAALLAFLQRVGVGSGDPRAADVRRCDGVGANSFYPTRIPDEFHQQCLRGLAAVERLFAEEAERIVAETSSSDFAYARLRLVGLQSWEGQAYYRGVRDYDRSVISRDSGMAHAFGALRDLRHPNVKTAIWAHNFHIAKDVESSTWNVKTMGAYLRETFGKSYAALALISNVTEIDWPTVGCGERPFPRTDRTVEKMLHDLGHETLLIDLDFPGGKPPFLAPGEDYRMSEAGMTPAAQFDGAVFLERSRKMDPLSWSSCQ